ncbi:MAG TPA: YfiR family protein [Gammaproteobacteria bacterium]|nr:YfiR family protein [Gammaproteobacteria bacterium]
MNLEMNIGYHPKPRIRRQTYCKPCLKRLLIKTATFLCMLALCSNASANNTEYRIKAAYLYQFTKFTQWPAHLFSEKDASIKICILGKNPFGTLLDNFTRKTSQQRTLTISYLSSFKKLPNCHVIFISRSEEGRLAQILRKVGNSPILTVSDIDNFVQRGGIIGFFPKQKKVKITINVRASRAAGAKLSSKLLEVATLVQNKKGESSQ